MSGGNGGLGFDLNFLMNLLGSIDEFDASLCSSRSIKKEGMYMGCNKMGVNGISDNEEFHNGKYEMKLPIIT